MKRNNSIFVIFSFLIFLNILAWIVVFDLRRPWFLEVTFFDVGQGDSVFIETPQRHQILIDGGPDSTILEKLAKEIPFWDRSIDLIILTHPEKDHIFGLLEVLKRYKVENILWTGVLRDTPEAKEWQNLIKGEKAKIKIAKTSQRIKLAGTVLDVLYPLENLKGRQIEDSNNTSIVAILIFGKNSFLNSTEGRIQGSHGVRFLFTGDIYKSVEEELLRKEISLDSDILKIAHHGSKTSSSEEFLLKVSPEIAIIQVGKDNSYGHPHREALERLEKFGIKILRTDREGDIKIFSNGEKYKIEEK